MNSNSVGFFIFKRELQRSVLIRYLFETLQSYIKHPDSEHALVVFFTIFDGILQLVFV